ncbi:unnamed protein product [Darwinula stevensoni]|uniref:5'-nucleotidase n=1 Tax=Darwinula stevensoni TaxID=69355 RepID=A0A7R9A7F8_9CRUS|nr:unnamed protein product [Darwinula stevensoni]CAG0891638.1 unnamed protein product [Darwinula stevensoni]
MEGSVEKYPNIEHVNSLQHPSVHIRYPEKLDKILEGLFHGGLQQLQVIADFDMTISRFHLNNERCLTCYGILSSSKHLPASYREAAEELKNKYYPIEICHEMSAEQKIPYMLEWYHKAHQLLAQSCITRQKLKEMVSNAKVALRDGATELFLILATHDVPLLIFSAGLGDLIEEGHMTGLKGDLIHMFNKNETAVQHEDYFKQLKGKNNVILLGDSLGDVHMATGVIDINVVLKIGFLNDNASTFFTVTYCSILSCTS